MMVSLVSSMFFEQERILTKSSSQRERTFYITHESNLHVVFSFWHFFFSLTTTCRGGGRGAHIHGVTHV